MDKTAALAVLGLDEDFDESGVGRAKKKLGHKNRAVSPFTSLPFDER